MNLPPPPHPMQVVQCNPNFQRTLNVTWIIANSHRLSRCTLFWCSRTHKCPWYIQIFIALVTTVCCQYDTFPLIGPTSNLKTSDIPHWLKVSHLPLIDEKKKEKAVAQSARWPVRMRSDLCRKMTEWACQPSVIYFSAPCTRRWRFG